MDDLDFEILEEDITSKKKSEKKSEKKSDKKKAKKDKKSDKKVDKKKDKKDKNKNHKKKNKKDKNDVVQSGFSNKESISEDLLIKENDMATEEDFLLEDADISMSEDEVDVLSSKEITSEPQMEKDIIAEESFDNDEDFEILEEDIDYVRNKAVARKKKMIRLIIVAVVLMIACAIGCYTFIIKHAELDKFESALHEGQYSNAQKIYTNLMDSQLSQADIMIAEKVKSVYSKYYKKGIKSDKAIEEIKAIDKISDNKIEEINDMLILYKKILVSEANYIKACELYNSENLVQAINEFKKVIKEDAYYKDAQNQLKKASSDYKKIRIEESEKYAENEEYDAAIKVMTDVLKILSDDEQILKQLQIYKSAKLSLSISDIMDKVDVYSKKKEYVAAVKVINNAITEYGEDIRLIEMMSSIIDNMYKEIEEYIKSERYTVAISILKSYKRVNPDDNKAIELINKYASKVEKGNSITKIKTASEEGKSYVIDDVANYTDSKGNKYEYVVEVVGYRNLDKTGNMVFSNNKYTTLSGTIGYVSSEEISYYKEGKGIIRIYGDDKELYKSPIMSEDSDIEEVNINIAKYKTIKITWSPSDSKIVKTYGIVLGDFMFK